MAANLLSAPVKRTLLFCCAVLMFAAPALHAADDWRYEETRRDSRDFVSGGFIHVRMTVGDLHIKRGDSNQIGTHTWFARVGCSQGPIGLMIA